MSVKLDNTMYVKIEFVLIILFWLTFIKVIKYKFILKGFRYIEEFLLIFISEKTYFTYLMFGNFCFKVPVSSIENSMASLSDNNTSSFSLQK